MQAICTMEAYSYHKLGIKTKCNKDINIRESKAKNTLMNAHKNQGNHEVLL